MANINISIINNGEAMINYQKNEFGDIDLGNGVVVNLTQHAYNDNDSNGHPAWFASGYLSTDIIDEQTGPTVKVCWESLGASESDEDADWDNPSSIMHYSRGELLAKAI